MLIIKVIKKVILSLLRFIYKYIRYHITTLIFFTKKITLNTNRGLFCFLFNLNALIRKKNIKFYYDVRNKIYFAKSDKYKKYFYSKYQNYNSYINGIEERGTSIGKEYFLDKIKFNDKDIVIDVGANVGDLKIYFDKNNLNVQYIGIEPSPKEYYCLEKNVAPSKTFNVGLWNKDGELNFYISSDNADSSFIMPPKYCDEIKIQSKRLDSFFDQNIKLLKVEAEGAETEVILGCEKLLSRIDYISADLGFERGMSKKSTLADVTNLLLKNNFKMIDFNSRIVILYKRNI